MGQYKKAMAYTVLIAFILFELYLLVMFELNYMSGQKEATDATLFVMMSAGFLFFSFLGWLLVGLPTHWFVVHICDGKLWCYALAIIIFGLLIGVTTVWEIGAACAFVAVIQVTVFLILMRYFERKST
jgi:hypothetical protein